MELKHKCLRCGSPCGYTGFASSEDCSNSACTFASVATPDASIRMRHFAARPLAVDPFRKGIFRLHDASLPDVREAQAEVIFKIDTTNQPLAYIDPDRIHPSSESWEMVLKKALIPSQELARTYRGSYPSAFAWYEVLPPAKPETE